MIVVKTVVKLGFWCLPGPLSAFESGATRQDRTGDLLITKPRLSSLRRDLFSQLSLALVGFTAAVSTRTDLGRLTRFRATC